MGPDDLAHETIPALLAARCFEEAAEVALGGMLAALAATSAELRPAGRGRVSAG